MLKSSCKILVQGLNLARLLSDFEHKNIPILYVEKRSKSDFLICLPFKYKQQGVALLQQKCYNIKNISSTGTYATIAQLKKHYLVVLAIFLLIPILALLSTVCLAVEVDDEYKLEVLNLLEESNSKKGIFLAKDCDYIAGYLSSKIDCAYCLVDKKGCFLFVDVIERTSFDSIIDLNEKRNVVATRNGEIMQMAVLQGEPRCSVGDKVTAGQVLVEGVTVFHDETTAPVRAIARILVKVSVEVFAEYEKTQILFEDTGNSYFVNLIELFGFEQDFCQSRFEFFRIEQQLFEISPFLIKVKRLQVIEQIQTTKYLSENDYVENAKQKALDQAMELVDFDVLSIEYEFSEKGVKAIVYGKTLIS